MRHEATQPERLGQLSFTSVRFRNFKAFKNFSVALSRTNVLVGPNNSGKSTVVGAFRVLSAALRGARTRSPERVPAPGGQRGLGYRVSEEAIPISMENAQTDYDETVDTTITFRLSDGKELVLFFPPGRNCFLFADPGGRSYSSPSQFRAHFEVTVGVVPVLGPLEHDELLVEEETVNRNLATHRASRHFRNYWYRRLDEFDDFRDKLRSTWRGIDIKPPEIILTSGEPTRLVMFCSENRIERELYWAGFGFQVWCQILTHVLRARDNSILVVDEPEIYLHPDLQRELLVLLKELGPDVLLATHSSEIVSQVEPSDILLVNKAAQSARRVSGIEGVRSALERLGSIQNVALTQLARTRRVMFVEGEDMAILARFGRLLGLRRIAASTDLAVFPTGGFPRVDALRSVRDGIGKALGVHVMFAGVFDRDYRSREEVDHVLEELGGLLDVRYILARKELENYLLVVPALQRAVVAAVRERARRAETGFVPPTDDIGELLKSITEDMRVEVLAQTTTTRVDYLKKVKSGISAATLTAETTRDFEALWASLELRLEIVPGKEVLTRLNERLQQSHAVALTPRAIVDAFKPNEVPGELAAILRSLEAFCAASP